MAKRNSSQSVQIGGNNTGEINQISDDAETEQEVISGVAAELDTPDARGDVITSEAITEAAQEHYAAKEELRQEHGEVLPGEPEHPPGMPKGITQEEAQAFVNKFEEEFPEDKFREANRGKIVGEVLPADYHTSKTMFAPTPAQLPLAERFQHLTETEIRAMAAANSWSNEFTMTVIDRRTRGSVEREHQPMSPSEIDLTIDKGHQV